jgi:hypothetical protein
LKSQPAQSPYLNILDLDFFHSLKARVSKLKIGATSLDDLMARVNTVLSQYDRQTLDSIWAQLFTNYNYILREKGDYDSKVHHAGNRRNQGDKDTKCDLSIDVNVYNDCVRHVNEYRKYSKFKLLR